MYPQRIRRLLVLPSIWEGHQPTRNTSLDRRHHHHCSRCLLARPLLAHPLLLQSRYSPLQLARMKKTRMSIDDIHAMVGSIRKNVLDMRVTNIYDLQAGGDGSSKTYILKLHQPPFPKLFLLLESGVRFHTSKYARDASAATSSAALPSQFTMKLRKHLRGKRLVALAQLEGDRVVDFTFGSDALQCHLILELYAAGNIILTDGSYNILSLLRTHKFDENVKVAVKQVYPVQVLGASADADADAGREGAVVGPKDRCIQTVAALSAFVDKWFAEQRVRAATTGAGKKKQAQQTLKQLLLVKDSTFGGLGPVIVEHCIVRAELAPTLKIKAPEDLAAIGEDKLGKLLEELRAGWDLLDKLQSEQVNTSTVAATDAAPPAASDDAEAAKRGFIILKDSSRVDAPEQFEEFTPYLYAQHLQAHKKVRAFATFDEAVDEYFSRFEAEVAQVAKQNAQAAAENKLAKLKKNQQQQLAQLEDVQNQSLKHARLIESNQQDVENVLLVIRSALASGMDWRELEELVRYEQKNGNPVASLIHQLDLEHNRVSILLCDGDDDEDVEEDEEDEEDEDSDDKNAEDKKAHVILIDLALSALGNAREIYAKKKKAGEKAKKAAMATERAILQAEKNTKKTLQKQQMTRHTIYQRRKVMWFEKFHWFLTSENYLVIAGKDAHQNELLVKRYLRKGDAYVHADLHGAATCVVRNRVAPGDKKSPPPPIPVASLEQAGCMSVCRSNAWTSQVIAGAYWVHADQVSKTAPAGEYLSTGSFMIRGKKNYIPPSRLEMGLAIIFRVDESCISNHTSAMSMDALERAEEAEEEQEEKVAEPASPVKTVEEGAPTVGVDASALAVEETSAPNEDAGPAVDADEQNEATGEDAAASSRDGKKRLTAKDRRDLKKGKTPSTPANGDSNDGKKEQQQPLKKGKREESNKPANDSQKNVRGKKGKMKKMKKKYADQDDEDRRLRMEALGHAVDSDDKTIGDDDKGKESEDEEEEATEDGAVPAKKKEVDEEYIRQQREKKEKFLDEQEEEAETADFFDAFTGTPLPNDIVLFALPVCAPYSSLGKYKYKVKLLPGSQKKGKAAKQAMEHFFSSNLREEKQATTKPRKPTREGEAKQEEHEDDEATPDVDPVIVQRELMKCIPENELVNCLVGPLKISAPGLHAGAGSKKGGSGKKGGGGKKGKK